MLYDPCTVSTHFLCLEGNGRDVPGSSDGGQ